MKTIMYSAFVVLIATAVNLTLKEPTKEPYKTDKKEKELDSLIDFSIEYESKIDDSLRINIISKAYKIDSLNNIIKQKDLQLKNFK